MEDTPTSAPAPAGLTSDELDAEGAAQLPDKQAMSILDITANIDVGLDVAGMVDAAVAANANAAAPAEAAATVNVVSPDATAMAVSDQSAEVNQHLGADAIATANQEADIDQASTEPAHPTGTP
jgi:hypothetical protein